MSISNDQPSQHRPDFSSLVHQQISLQEKQNEKDLAKNSLIDELPELNMDQLGELGLLDGPQGRRIFENIYDKENEKNFPRRTDEEPTNIEIPLDNPESHNLLIDTPQNLQLSIPNEPQLSIQDELQIVPPINETQHSSDQSGLSVDQYAARLAIIERAAAEVDENQQKTKVVKRKARRPRVKAIHRIGSTLNFYKPLIVKKPKKILKKRKNPHRVSVVIGNDDLNLLEEMKEFIEFELPDYDEDEEETLVTQKEKAGVSELPTVELDVPQMNLEVCDLLVNKEAPQNILNIPEAANQVSYLQQSNIELPEIPQISLEGSILPQVNMEIPEPLTITSNFGASKQQVNMEKIPAPTTFEDSGPLAISNIREAPQSNLEIPSIPQDNLTLPEIPQIQISLDETNKRPFTSPELKNDSKRTKITQDLEIPDLTITNQQKSSKQVTNENIQIEISAIAPPDISNPRSAELRSKFQSSIASAFEIFRRKTNPNGVQKNQVTAKDVEYSRLMEISKQVESTLPEIPQQELEIIAEDTPAEVASTAPQDYKEFKKNGIEMIQFKDNSGNLVQFEDYNAENFVLYLQLRKYMKMKGSWKLNVQQILNDEILKLLHTKSKRVIEQRLWRLCDRGLLKGTWSDDDLNLLEIEIPIQSERQAENKENIP